MKKLFAVATIAILALIALPQAQAQTVSPPQQYTFPLYLTQVTNAQTSVASSAQLTAGAIPVPIDSILVLQLSMTTTNDGTSNTVFSFKTSIDGITWATTAPHTLTVACASNATVNFCEPVATNIAGRFIALSGISTTQTNTVTFSNFKYCWIKR